MLAEKCDATAAQEILSNGRDWNPTLSKPAPPPSRFGFHRCAESDKPVLILDNRQAAIAAENMLPGYLVCNWPDGNSRWDGLEPLRGRTILLWPTIDGLEKMERLERVLTDPAGLACTGSFIVPSDLAPWDADTDTLIKWAKERKRSLTYPAQQVADGFRDPESAEGTEMVPNAEPTAPLPPALASPADAGLDASGRGHVSANAQDGDNSLPDARKGPYENPEPDAPQGDLSHAEPPPVHDTDWPPGASTKPRKARQRHLRAVDSGNLALAPDADPIPQFAPLPGAPDWSVILERTKAGYINNLDNVVRVIEADPTLKGHIWYDEFLDSIVSDWQDPARRWRDSDDVLLQLYVQRHVGLTKIGANTAHDAALVAAFRNVRNECREWLEALTWDRTPRLAHMLSDAFGAEHNSYSEAVGRCWFISMVARVMEPGCKVDTVPVLEGAQGVGKSSALKIIGDKWFAECHESVLTKDWYGVLDGHMLVEISEMHSFTRGEVERVKGLISCQVDRYRKAYGRNTEDHPRQSVLVCTTNRDDWQRDETGARRFWPVLCGAIDLDWLRTNRDNLFAEAVHLYREGVTWWDVGEPDQEFEVEKRRDADAWEPLVSDWLKGRDKVTTGDILATCLDLPPNKQDVIYQRRVSRVMRALEWKQHVLKESGVNTRTWIKPFPLPKPPRS